MVRFLGSIIIALSIEALMLVFKFAITDPEKLLYAMYIIGGVSMLLITLAIYIKFTKLKIDE
jgi:putative Mn2+ efflux pump MntP